MALWKNIKKGWDKLSSFTSFEVGDGSKISFWHDQWCGETTLNVAFPVLYGFAREDAFIADNLEFLGDSNQWNVSFTRVASD